jgi:hypothetical protein
MTFRVRRVAFWAAIVAIQFAILEVGCFLTTRMRPDLFDQREAALAKLVPKEFEQFKASIASNLLGWDNPATVTRLSNCVGQEVTYSYNPTRVRMHGDRKPEDSVILAAGGSYTQGYDVADDDTYPAALERILGVPVANLGVGGFGPDQALLKLESLIEHFPRARVALLSIFYPDTSRMMNSFRPVFFPNTGVDFGLKPFVRDGAFQALAEGDPFRDLAAMRSAAERAFDTDFWRRARPNFPYSVAVAEMISLPSFWMPWLTQFGKFVGRPRHEALYLVPSVRANLRALYDRFAKWTNAHGLRGIVAFIPTDGADQISGLVAISAATPDQRSAVTFVNAEISDWSEFDLAPGCHPSPTGHRRIAERVAALVRPMLPDIINSSTLRSKPQ